MASMPKKNELIRFSFNEDMRRRVESHIHTIALTVDELELLFGSHTHKLFASLNNSALEVCVQTEEVAPIIETLQRQIQNAFVDPLISSNWSTPRCKLAAILSLACEDVVDALRVTVGPFGEADARRVRQCMINIEDDLSMRSKCIVAVDRASVALFDQLCRG